MQSQIAASRTAQVVEEYLLLEAMDVENDGESAADLLSDEILSSAGGPYRWDSLVSEFA